MEPNTKLFPKTAKKPILSCVVDRKPKFLMQAWIWLVSAKECGAFNDCDVVIHHIGQTPKVLTRAAKRFGARVIEVETFGAGSARFCNKLQSHGPIISSGGPGAILTDVDLFFLQSPITCFDEKFIQSKIVDMPNPPAEVLSKLCEKLGLPGEAFNTSPTFAPDTQTHRFNCNGGLYAVPMRALEKIHGKWRSYSEACLSEEELLGKWHHHADQLGFMMALIESQLPFRHLNSRDNFPTQFKPEILSQNAINDIVILHYHRRLNHRGRLKTTKNSNVDVFIQRANTILAKYDHCPEYQRIQTIYAKSL